MVLQRARMHVVCAVLLERVRGGDRLRVPLGKRGALDQGAVPPLVLLVGVGVGVGVRARFRP